MATKIPRNGASHTLAEIAAATAGRVHGAADTLVRGVSTDTRDELAGQLFVALRGGRFDGHRYLPQAVAAGAVAVLGESLPPDVTGVEVADSLRALGDLAGMHRRRWAGRIVAVAGSAGKTTTRSLIGAMLSARVGNSVHLSAGNLNNLIGVPMVLLGLESRHELGVVELGTNRTGEVARLVDISMPDVCVLTLIDLEHTEGLGDLDAIEREEGAILRPGAELHVGNVDDERVARALQRSVAERKLGIGYGSSAHYRVLESRLTADCESHVRIRRPDNSELACSSPFLGMPGALAVAMALAVAEHTCGSRFERDSLENVLALPQARQPGRLAPVPLADGSLVIDDTYNANPASVRAAIDVAREVAALRGAKLHLVLGEMRELGPWSQSEHQKLSPAIAAADAASTSAICGDARLMLSDLPSHRFFESSEEAARRVVGIVGPGDVVLVKASRGVRAELVVDALSRQRGLTA